MSIETLEAPPGASKTPGGAAQDRQSPSQGSLHFSTATATCKHYEQEAVAVTVNPLIESTIRALNALSPQNQELVTIMIRQLAEREGITMETGPSLGLQTPAEGIPLWLAKLKQESFSKRTIELYLLTIKNYLRQDPIPTKLSIQKWLAERMELISTAKASNDRKALRSFFSFLYKEGLWPVDPTSSIKHIRVRYRARELPETENVYKLMEYECHRSKDTAKFRTMTVVLITTGLRITEAASIRKSGINLKTGEIKVVGKGDKEGVVPLLPIAIDFLRHYLEEHSNDSPFLFPGETDGGFWNISAYEKSLRRACDKLGIKRMTPHQLRHFFATYALRGGAKLEVVSKILRHASVAITADIYRHVMTDELHETVTKFGPLAGQNPLALPDGESSDGESREKADVIEGEVTEVPNVLAEKV